MPREEKNWVCSSYRGWDVPRITNKFIDLWDEVALSNTKQDQTRRRSFSPDDLNMIENDFLLILWCSNFTGKIGNVENTVVLTSSTRPAHSRSRVVGGAYFSGGTTDNASDALKETRITSDTIMEECIKSNDESINKLPFINGVRRRPIVFGDLFHWSNLAVMHASWAMSGKTENEEHG